MTSAQAKECIEGYLREKGYSRKACPERSRREAQRHTYWVNSDGSHRFRLSSTTITPQGYLPGIGWHTRRPAKSLIRVAQNLEKKAAEAAGR